jgi:transposase
MPVRDARKGGARRRYDDRLVLDAIFFVLRSGCQWRMIPRDLLPWDAAYRWYRHWRRDGTWDRVHDTLRDLVRAADGRDPEPSAAVLDAQSIVSGEGGQARGFDMAKQTRGRKRHLVVDTLGLVLVVMVTSAAVQDRPGGRAILAVGRRVPHRRAGLGRWRLRQPHRQLPAGMSGAKLRLVVAIGQRLSLDDPSRRAIRLGQSARAQIRRRSDTLQPSSAQNRG